MFGNCPRAVWERWCPPDALGRIALACRALLVREDGGRTVLLEAGIGSFFAPKLRERFGVQESEHVLLSSLAALGVKPDDVDVIVLSHLHFDHAGGLLAAWAEGVAPALAFPRARYVVGARAWARARAPHFRDRASFIPELPALLEGSPWDSADLLGVFPHMHAYGRSMRLEVVGDGEPECAAEVPRWDFNWQLQYFYEQPRRLNADDVLRVTCNFDTTAADGPVLPGWGTYNEMCLMGMLLVP